MIAPIRAYQLQAMRGTANGSCWFTIGMLQHFRYVLYPLDLYNDSANYALTGFKKQFLYVL
jgi:hypothetical protein